MCVPVHLKRNMVGAVFFQPATDGKWRSMACWKITIEFHDFASHGADDRAMMVCCAFLRPE